MAHDVSMSGSIATGFIVTTIMLLCPLFYKLLQLCLVYLRVPWKNTEGKRMSGELPRLPWGHFNQVNFFGRPLSKKHGPVYYIWHCFTPVVILADAKAIRTFYADHYSHQRERNFTCLGAVFKDILGNCLATSHGRDEVKRCRGPFEKHFSTDVVCDTLKIIGLECKTFLETLPVGKPVDLQEAGLANVTLRVLVHVVYGNQVLQRYFQRIVELSDLLQAAVDMFNVGETRLPFYSLLPTKANQKARSFNEAWDDFNRFLFKEYEEGRLNAGDGFFFGMMEQLKTRALEMDEKELFHSVDEILLLNIDVSFAATSFALADLAQYKDTQEKVQQEIDEVLRGGDPSSFPDLEKKLPYMEMVLKESARMHPALALSLPERTVKQVTDLGGFQIPKGNQLPQEINKRSEKFLTQEELIKLMEWKLMRGKFRPRLTQLVRTNDSETVKEVTSKAFKCLPDIKQAINELTKLKAVGPATASAILCAGSHKVPFMADESIQAIPGFGKIEYSLKFYLDYNEKIGSCLKHLHKKDPKGEWNEHKIELGLWTHAIGQKYAPELFNRRSSSKRKTEERESRHKSKKTKV